MKLKTFFRTVRRQGKNILLVTIPKECGIYEGDTVAIKKVGPEEVDRMFRRENE